MSDELGITLSATLVVVALTAACGRPPDASNSAKAAAPAVSPGPHAAVAGSMTLAATLDGTRYSLSGDGECSQADPAAIHGVPAAMWHASLKSDAGPISYVNLTVWQFKDGAPNQFSLGLQVGGVFHHASIIKGATVVGSGTARVDRAGDGATLQAVGTEGKGAAFDVAIHCTKVTQTAQAGR
jgi:hypothetical protein